MVVLLLHLQPPSCHVAGGGDGGCVALLLECQSYPHKDLLEEKEAEEITRGSLANLSDGV